MRYCQGYCCWPGNTCLVYTLPARFISTVGTFLLNDYLNVSNFYDFLVRFTQTQIIFRQQDSRCTIFHLHKLFDTDVYAVVLTFSATCLINLRHR